MTNGPLPQRVSELLKASKFLHLATCSNDVPHVSLMNFTFIEPSQQDCALLQSNKNMLLVTTPKDTKKFQNLQKNDKVSILIHDWVTSASPAGGDVLKLLQSINQTEVGDLSITLDGRAVKYLLDNKSEEYTFFKDLHLKKNPDAKAFVEGDNVALILIQIEESKVSDSHNNVENFK